MEYFVTTTPNRLLMRQGKSIKEKIQFRSDKPTLADYTWENIVNNNLCVYLRELVNDK